VNQTLALFHYATMSYGEIIKYNDIVDMNKKNIDLDVPLYFLEVHCRTVEEARKRACILAYLTYDIRKSVYVKLFTKTMLEDPFFYSNIRKCWSHFNIKSVDISLAKMSLTNSKKAPQSGYNPTKVEMCPHDGIIVSRPDHNYIKGKYDKLKFSNGKVVYHNIPPIIVHNKLDVEFGYMYQEEEVNIVEFMRPKKEASLTIDKKMEWKQINDDIGPEPIADEDGKLVGI
jgi:hypothetical protein